MTWRNSFFLIGVVLLVGPLIAFTSCEFFSSDSDTLQLAPIQEGQLEEVEYSTSDYVEGDDMLVVQDYPRCEDDPIINYIYLEFDLSELPEEADIISARLDLFLDMCDGTDGRIAAFDVLEPWNEGDISPEDPEVGDQAHDPQAMPDEDWEKWIHWDVTEIVQNWVDGDEEPSLMLKQIDDLEIECNEDEITREMLMAFFNSTNAEENHPRLVIRY